jgi:hypothetical protein
MVIDLKCSTIYSSYGEIFPQAGKIFRFWLMVGFYFAG